ncbi:MAG TPA: hydantoinase/carbamoylase family amidase [Bryobacteraceae bacterium]|nr:hydantoinase/carbamoylase family amidase [Bryobacteraceae bacterium]
MGLDPKRTIRELKELRALTATEDGAQRVAWTDVWLKSRDWFASKLLGLPVEHHLDAAGNRWVTMAGESEKALILGSHLDSVPNGGWLDGSLGVLAALEVMRRIAIDFKGRPPVTIRLVDFADEEGARFGRSLLGSSAFAGTHSVEADRVRTDKDGIRMDQALRRCGVDMDRFPEAAQEQKNAAAYLELHIEQGPVLENLMLPLGVVLGTKGVERHSIVFYGQEAHSGATPMKTRRDALAAAAKLALEIRTIAGRHPDAVCTIGSLKTFPGIVTAVVGRAETTLDQRDLSAAVLAQMYREAREASERFAKEEKCTVEWSRIWNIEPIQFHRDLVELCRQAVMETAGVAHQLPSGPLHDAAEVSRAGIPTVMMFVQSIGGISHNKVEDSSEEHLEMAVRAFDRLASKTMRWIESGSV